MTFETWLVESLEREQAVARKEIGRDEVSEVDAGARFDVDEVHAEVITDLITDLLHLAERKGLDAERIADNAHNHFNEENGGVDRG